MTEKDKSTVLLEYSLKKLKLPNMLREYAALATVCQKDRSDYPTYLLRLTERELLDREKRAAERRIKDANFPVIKTIDTYDFSAQPSINEPLVRELLREGVPGQKRKRAVHRKPGNRQNAPGLRPGVFRLRPRQKCPLLYGHRSCHPAGGAPGRKKASATAQTAPEAPSTGD